MASFHVRSKVSIAHIHVRSKVCQFAPHIDGSNADFAPHIDGSNADCNIISVNFQKIFLQNNYILGVYIIYLTIFENKNILRESYGIFDENRGFWYFLALFIKGLY